jgi:hypothetical protein
MIQVKRQNNFLSIIEMPESPFPGGQYFTGTVSMYSSLVECRYRK